VAITKLKLIANGGHAAKRLNEALADWLTEELKRPVSKAKARKLIIAGAVYVNNRRVIIASQRFSPGAALEARVDLAKLFGDSTSRDREFELTADRILFEDEDLIVIDKPPGLPAQPTLDESRNSLFAAAGRFFSRRDEIAKPYVGVHQRLDRDTSGVVLFTKSRRVNAAVAKSFSSHLAIKTYNAITIFRPDIEREWTIKNYLAKTSSKSKRSRYGAVRSDGDFAETSFRVIAERPGGVWVEAIPKTGRTHQIRVHLSEYGLPILGDDLYGADDGLAPRLMLHAVQLRLPHPLTGRELSINSPLPADFKQCLRRVGHDGPR
jgi:23S rRNA pseudouridine1911/1915/1917 synthase